MFYLSHIELIIQQGPNPSPLPWLLLILAVVGAIVDWRYRRAGGRPSSRRDRILFWLVVGIVILLLLIIGFLGGNSGAASVPIAVLLFAVWELGRWRMRRKYPLPKVQPSETKQP